MTRLNTQFSVKENKGIYNNNNNNLIKNIKIKLGTF